MIRFSLVVALSLSLQLGARAQEAEPLPPSENAPPPVEEEVPESAADAALANTVARDVYLGGAGVLGPAMVVSMAAYVAPALGGLLGAWSAEQALPTGPGSALKGLASAYAATLTEQLAGSVTSILTVAGMYAAFLPGYALVAVAIAMLMLQPLTLAMIGTTAMLMGGGALWMVVGMVPVIGIALVGAALGSRLAVLVGDLVWTNVNVSLKANKTDLSSLRVPIGRPMDTLPAAGLVAAAAAGSMRRVAWMASIPVVGPLLFALSARGPVAERTRQAHTLTGRGETADLSRVASGLLITRGVLGTVGHLSLVLGLGVGVAMAAAVLGAGAVLAGIPGVNALGAAAGLLLAAEVLAIGVIPVMLLGLAAVVGESALGMVTPWILGAYAVAKDAGPAERSDDDAVEDVKLNLTTE